MKRLTVAVALDDECGMMFNNRRQSRDRVMIAEMIETAGGPIAIHQYSAKLFPEGTELIICDDPLRDAPRDSFCFIENLPIRERIEDISRFVIYRWNRLYPADKHFDVDLGREGFREIGSTEFEGSSHEKISKGIYER